MCGRYTLAKDLAEIKKRFDVTEAPKDFKPRYNIAPNQQIPIILLDGEKKIRKMGLARWGLIPSWAVDPSIGNRMINARSETITTKPSFKNLFKKRRCIVPADSFYEWKKISAKEKIPVRVLLTNEELFGFAGLWTIWRPGNGNPIVSCVIITTEPNEMMAEIHNRMPLILEEKNERLWIDPAVDDEGLLKSFLKPYPSRNMKCYPVSRYVNSPANDTPKCVEPTRP